jgi:hypothetical protein
MEMTFVPGENIVQINNARIIWRNFAGEKGIYNPEGKRTFNLVIPNSEMAEMLTDHGYNVSIRQPRDPGEEPLMSLKVTVNFNSGNPPACYLVSSGSQIRLNEDTVGRLDKVTIARVDMDIRPYDWEFGNRSGRSAYLHAIRVTQRVDRFAEYEEEDRY